MHYAKEPYVMNNLHFYHTLDKIQRQRQVGLSRFLELTELAPYLCCIFTHLTLCLADAIHNVKRVKIINNRHKMEVNYFQILLIDVAFYMFNMRHSYQGDNKK